MKRINRFDAAVALVFDMFFLEEILDGLAGVVELFVSALEAVFGELLELLVTLWIEIFETGFLDFDTDATHLETVGEWGKDIERFARDFLLFIWREGAEGAEIMEAVGEFDDEDADVLTGRDEEFEEVVTSLWEITLEVFHAATGFAEFRDTINEEGDVLAELLLDFLERKVSVFDGIVKNAGNDGVVVHVPLFEDFLDRERMNDVWLAGFTQLALVRLGGDVDGLIYESGCAHSD